MSWVEDVRAFAAQASLEEQQERKPVLRRGVLAGRTRQIAVLPRSVAELSSTTRETLIHAVTLVLDTHRNKTDSRLFVAVDDGWCFELERRCAVVLELMGRYLLDVSGGKRIDEEVLSRTQNVFRLRDCCVQRSFGFSLS
jgi:hypothetical protein